MITFKGNLENYFKTFNNEIILTIKTSASNIPDEQLTELKANEKGLKVDLSKWREKRSLDANAYAWVLMEEISKVIKSTKEEVYKGIIKKVGVFEILPIKNTTVESFKNRWQSKGLGWLCEIQRDSKIPNYTNVIAYYGTSTYNTEEMARFIDEIVVEAQALGIQTETPEKLEEIKSRWEYYEKQNI